MFSTETLSHWCCIGGVQDAGYFHNICVTLSPWLLNTHENFFLFSFYKCHYYHLTRLGIYSECSWRSQRGWGVRGAGRNCGLQLKKWSTHKRWNCQFANVWLHLWHLLSVPWRQLWGGLGSRRSGQSKRDFDSFDTYVYLCPLFDSNEVI